MITHRFIDAFAPAARLPWARAAAATLAAAVTLNGCSKDPAGAPDAAPAAHHEHSDEVTLRAEAITRYGITLGRASRVALQDSSQRPRALRSTPRRWPTSAPRSEAAWWRRRSASAMR
jgi:hypothetical protein